MSRFALGVISGATAALLLKQSVLFDGAAKMTRTPSVAGNLKMWTWSGWIKPTEDAIVFFQSGISTDYSQCLFTSGKLYFQTSTSGTMISNVNTDATFVDYSGWYHVVYVVDTSAATAADRVQIWVNGTRATLTITTQIALNADTWINSTSIHRISSHYSGADYEGRMARVELIDGAALSASDFGETDVDGFWNPVEFTGTTTADNTSVSGTATAESTFGAFPASQAFDGNTSTRWVSSATPAWLEYDRGSGNGVISAAYSMACGPSGTASISDMPEDWTIEGYNGSTWDTLSTVTGEAAWTLGETRQYTFTNTTSYEKYRIDVTLQQGGGAEIEIGELLFYADSTTEGYGTNGALLEFATNTDYGSDTSGNSNDYTDSGFATTDQSNDVPTNSADDGDGNFSQWNPLDGGTGTLSEGNLVSVGTTDRSGTIGVSSGKWAWKVTANATAAFGLVQGSLLGTESTYSATSADVLEFQFNADTGALDVSVNGGAYSSAATGLTSGPYFPLAKGACTADFGQSGFVLDDSAFKYIATQNLPASHPLYTGTVAQYRAGVQVTTLTDNRNTVGNTGYTFRSVIPTAQIVEHVGTRMRIRMTAHASEGLEVDKMYIGTQASSGNAWDYDGNQVQITLNGETAFTLPAGSVTWSDWFTFTRTAAGDLVLGFDIGSAAGDSFRLTTGITGGSWHILAATANAEVTAPAGLSTTAGYIALLTAIEVQ